VVQPRDWRSHLLAGRTLRTASLSVGNPIEWPGYTSVPAVGWTELDVDGGSVVACVWDFAVHGGSFGVHDAATFAEACAEAVRRRVGLVSLIRSGGTRLQEGVAALAGIAGSLLALEGVAAAGLPHLAVVDHPTTGGVWVGIAAPADLRVALAGATVGFAGPRVVAEVTRSAPAEDSHTAAAAAAAGLVDRVVEPAAAADTIRRLAGSLPRGPGQPGPRPSGARRLAPTLPSEPPPARGGWEQVQWARSAARPGGWALLATLLDDLQPVRGADHTVRAGLGRSAAGRPTLGVALAADRGVLPSAAGFRLLGRCARLADRWDCDLLTLVDTPGADPSAGNEVAGLAPAIATAMRDLLHTRGPTLCVVHGEGGSGGALAGAVTDCLLLTGDAYFTALAPEGAAVTLRTTPAGAADLLAVTPRQLLDLGFADGVAGTAAAAIRGQVADTLAALAGGDPDCRLAARRARWSQPLLPALSSNAGTT
jgi:acetyl-CoA carboxylase alpha subunit